MKPIHTRRIRRRSNPTKDTVFFKSNEQTFFSESLATPFFPATNNVVHRKCEGCEKEDKKMMKKDSGTNASVSHGDIHAMPPGGAVMPKQTQNFFGSKMGFDFSSVKIHTGTEAEKSAKAIHAKAYTVGNEIVFNSGQYNPQSHEGKKLLAHELVHVMQQGENNISRKEGEEEVDCGEEINLEGLTDAVYNKGAGRTIGEKKKASKDCEDCEDDCKKVSGTLAVPYKVATTVSLPTVPADLRPCQKQRVAAGIKNKLAPHEQKHVAAFKTFNGTAMLPINYIGCEGGYDSYLEELAEKEFNRRKDIADAKSAKLDPFSVDIDLCCKDKPKKK
jgi:hypothetical protein